MKSLRSPYVINYISHGRIMIDDSQRLALVMEKMEGNIVDLIDLISISELKKIFLQLFEGLQYIHSKGFTHGDLKPDNVFLRKTEEGFEGVWCDFGHAQKTAQKVYFEDELEQFLKTILRILILKFQRLGLNLPNLENLPAENLTEYFKDQEVQKLIPLLKAYKESSNLNSTLTQQSVQTLIEGL